MTLPALYAQLGSSYESIRGRIPSDQMIAKFVRMYASDPSFSQLCIAVQAQNWQAAFRAAHTLKGVAQNLGFDRLQACASALTEALRGGTPPADDALLDAVRSEHEQTLAAIALLD